MYIWNVEWMKCWQNLKDIFKTKTRTKTNNCLKMNTEVRMKRDIASHAAQSETHCAFVSLRFKIAQSNLHYKVTRVIFQQITLLAFAGRKKKRVATVMFLKIWLCTAVARGQTKLNSVVIDEFIQITCTQMPLSPGNLSPHKAEHIFTRVGMCFGNINWEVRIS